MFEYFIAALGLMLVIEGVTPFLFPKAWRTGLSKLIQFQDGQTRFIGLNEPTLFDEMKEEFSVLWVVVIYCLAQISLSYHLMHGFQSAFQTMGWNHPKYMPIIKKAGFWFAIIIPALFASMPIAMYLEYIK